VTRREQGGFGIGLWVVRQLVDAMHGEVLVTTVFVPPIVIGRAAPPSSSRFPRAALDTLLQTPTTTLLSADEAKDRLREIVDGFFFRRLAQ
jgi:hypothetical protein